MIPLMMLNYEKYPKYSWEMLLDPLLNIHDPHQAKLRFDAPFENNTRDYSPNNYSGTVNGLTIDKKGLYSDSHSDYYALNSAAFPSGTTDFTIEFWLYLRTDITNTYPFIISSSVYTNSGFYITCVGTPTGWTSYPDSYVSFSLGVTIGNSSVISKVGVRAKNWYHIAIVRRGASLYMYLNGLFQSKSSDTSVRSLISSGTPKIFGEASVTTGAEKGYISNVKFYNSAKYTGAYIPNFRYRGQTENYIAGLKNYNITGPIYLKKEDFQEEKDPYYNQLILGCPFELNYLDYSKNSYTATVSGTSFVKASTAPYIPYPAQSCLYFDGVDDRVQYTVEDLGTSDFTIEMFMLPYTSASQAYGRIFQLGANTTNGGLYFVRANNTPMSFLLQSYSGAYSNLIPTSNPTIAENVWHHIALTRDNGVFNLYINGIKTAGFTGFESYNISQTLLTIGANTTNTEEMSMLLQYFKIYKGIVKYTKDFVVNWNKLKMVSK